MSLSNTYEAKLLEHAFLIAPFAQLTHLYLGLSTADPGEDGSGVAEPSGNNYARVEFDTWTADGISGSDYEVSNNGNVVFNTPSGAWGDLTHVVLCAASTGGNVVASAALSAGKSPGAGDAVKFASGELVFSMSGFSDYLLEKLMKHLFKVAVFTQPTHIYVGLSTADPGGDGAGLAEPSGNGYARAGKDSWQDDGQVGGACQVSAQGTTDFGPASGGDWGTVTHAALFDASTAGNLLGSHALDTSKTIADGDDASFAEGALKVTLD